MIDKNWKSKYNENLINTLKFYSDKGYLEFKPFEQLKDGVAEMLKNPFKIIYVIIQGSLYPNY